MFTQFRTIAGNTFVEAIRQPIFTVVVLLVSGLIAINLLFSSFTLEDDNVLLKELGLSTMLMAGLLLAAFTATGVLAEEIERRTVLTVISKPVSRPLFLLAKYVGVLLALLLAEWIWALVFHLTVRHEVMMGTSDQIDVPVILFGALGFLVPMGLAGMRNYRQRRAFTSSLAVHLALLLPVFVFLALLFDKQWSLQSPLTDIDWNIMVAVVLLCEAIGIFCAVALAASTRLARVSTLLVCLVTLFLGMTSDFFFYPHADAGLLAKLAHAIIPNVQYLWVADALSQGSQISPEYLALASGYSILYTAGVLALAVLLFQGREVG